MHQNTCAHNMYIHTHKIHTLTQKSHHACVHVTPCERCGYMRESLRCNATQDTYSAYSNKSHAFKNALVWQVEETQLGHVAPQENTEPKAGRAVKHIATSASEVELRCSKHTVSRSCDNQCHMHGNDPSRQHPPPFNVRVCILG